MSKPYTEIESVNFSKIQTGNVFIIESNEIKRPTYKTFLTAIVKDRIFWKNIKFRMRTEVPALGINKYIFQSVLIQKLSVGEVFELRLSRSDAKMAGTLDWFRFGDISKITLVK